MAVDYTKITNRINKQKTDISASYDTAEAKGATIPTNKTLENLPSTLETITGGGGVDPVELTNLVVTLNGEYHPSPPYSGFKKVTVSVPTLPGDLPTPSITEYPRATGLTAGQTLSQSSLLDGVAKYGSLVIDGTFSWIAPTTIINNTSYHNVLFTPTESSLYETVIISVQVAVTEVPNNQVLKIIRTIGVSDPEWQKIGFNATLVANANKLSSAPSEFVPAQDDYFDNPLVPVYPKIKHCMVDDETGEIIAWHGDPDFRWDGSDNTSVYTYFPTFWIRRKKNVNLEEIEVSEFAITGGVKIDEFLFATFAMDWQTITLRDESGTKDVLRSYAGATPDYHYVDSGVNTVRTQAKATAGNNASGGDWRAIVIGLLHVVKYGTNAIQATIGTGRSTSSSGNTAQDDAHLILDGRDGYIGSQTSTSVWSLGICDFYSNKGILMDGIYSTGVDNRVRFCSDPSKFVQTPAEDQDGYVDLGYEMSYSNGYTRETGIDDTNENPVAQIIPLRVNGDTNATSSTGTTDEHYHHSSYRYAGYAGVYYSSTQGRGVFAFHFLYGNPYYYICSARVLRPITL